MSSNPASIWLTTEQHNGCSSSISVAAVKYPEKEQFVGERA